MDVAGRVSKVSGRTPLHHAAQAGDCEGVELLLESKAPQVSEKRGLTPLHVAVARRDEQLGIVQTLLAHMADDAAQVNAADEQEMTPLHHAVACGRLATVETLLAVRGIEVDARDRYVIYWFKRISSRSMELSRFGSRKNGASIIITIFMHTYPNTFEVSFRYEFKCTEQIYF